MARQQGDVSLEGDLDPKLSAPMDAQDNSIGFTLQSVTGDGTTTFNFSKGQHINFTFGAQNETFIFTPPAKPGVFTMKLIQDGVGGRTVTWPTVNWSAQTPPVLSTGIGAIDIISLRWDGTVWDLVPSLDFG